MPGLWQSRVVPHIASPENIVTRMLELGRVGSGDVVYDTGAGDGRIMIAACSRFGVRAVGIEIDGALVRLAGKRIKRAGIEDAATIERADFFESDIHEASVVTLYLPPKSNARLKQMLEEPLDDGSRVVSHCFRIPGWGPATIGEAPHRRGKRPI
jgi:tRNA G10  N-methylase Trm11